MTDNELRNLHVGDVVAEMFNGRRFERRLIWVGEPVQCINSRSGAYGHWARSIRWESGTGNGYIQTSIHSDEYTAGEGYPTYDQTGERIRGWELIYRAPNAGREIAIDCNCPLCDPTR